LDSVGQRLRRRHRTADEDDLAFDEFDPVFRPHLHDRHLTVELEDGAEVAAAEV